jgi:hypothetical protein
VDRAKCESIEDRTGDPCPCYAQWWIAVGDRRVDQQRACGRHLHPAARAMEAAEGRTGVKLTIYPV